MIHLRRYHQPRSFLTLVWWPEASALAVFQCLAGPNGDAAGAACSRGRRRRHSENGDLAPRGVIGRFARYRSSSREGS